MPGLEQRWPARLASRTSLRDRLVRAYADSARGYHDTRHLEEVLDHLDVLLALPEAAGADRDAVLLAAWFHDAVYDAAPDDEQRSAALAREQLSAADVPERLTEEVVRLVLLTRTHRPAAGDVAGQVLCDADLAILAAARERYEEYLRDVRREYAHLDEDEFRTGRARVVRDLLDRPRLFHTSYGRETWEPAARANLARELSAPGPP